MSKTVADISTTTAIADSDLSAGRPASLYMKDGLLFASRVTRGKGAKGITVTNAKKGQDVGIRNVEGVIKLEPAKVVIGKVPNVQNGQMHGRYGTPTDEGPGSEVARGFGIDDDHGELMVLINWNTDLGDAWEWAEDPFYPLKFSTYAFEVGVNMIVYAMSH